MVFFILEREVVGLYTLKIDIENPILDKFEKSREGYKNV